MNRISLQEVENFKATISRKFGLNLSDVHFEQLSELLTKRMRENGTRGMDSYLSFISRDENQSREELRTLAEQLTVNETYFFRHPDHFQAFSEISLPERIQARLHSDDGTRRLSVLSAGCSTGEEAYTLATLIRTQLPDSSSWDIRILGIDINPLVVEKARRARYSSWSFRGTPDFPRHQLFRPEGKEFALVDSIRNMVTFEERNLMEEDPVFWHKDRFDVIFCRNVLIYFSGETGRSVVQRLTHSLVPGGFLFLGPAETLRGISQEYHLKHSHETFYYQRKFEGEMLTVPVFPTPIPHLTTEAIHESLDDSWVDVIRRSTERIEHLAKTSSTFDARVTASARSRTLETAREFFKQERFEEAIGVLGPFTPESEIDTDSWLLRAVVLTNQGNMNEAEELCNRILAVDELNAGAHYLKALSCEHKGDHAGAIEQDNFAIYLDPSFAMPHFHLGMLAKRAGKADLARQELKQAVTLLANEDSSRILFFGGGFSREALIRRCHAELNACGEVAS